MSKFLRQSKFRHVYAQPLKRDQGLDNIRITKTSWDGKFCAVNIKFIAIVTESAGGGSFLVTNLSKVGRLEMDTPLVAGHKAAVLDISWCPHNDNIIASCSEDCTVKVWEIPDGGLTKNITEPVVDLQGHQRRVGQVVWHPSAQNILVSVGSDNKIIIWNVGLGEALTEISLPELPISVSFNYNGSRIACTCKDKKIRVIDPRTGKILQEGKGHQGSKPSQVVYLKSGKIFTTGFSRMSERQYALWNEHDLAKSLVMEEIDNSNGVMFPFYDVDTDMMYICGKGDTIIRYYEITDEAPYVFYLALYQASDPQRGMGFMVKRGLSFKNCEIARFYKLHNSGLCEVIPFYVPRKSELFQDDLYPDTAADIPAISADEWFEQNKDANPVLISLKEGHIPTKKEAIKVVRKANILDKMPIKKVAEPEPVAPPAAVLPPTKVAADFDPSELLSDLKALKDTVKQQDRRIEHLEQRIAAFESE